ncbi:MAG: 6-phosphogluconolactonase [Planctomycetes bacterium GWF2_41_51]|nr:MAG: 6-phosphogluconolactonase [Planctomycetes bacterium GWF2_41_51]HBG27293.1 6-phosphogluconolactonase [Phycisphaerales bacterium]
MKTVNSGKLKIIDVQSSQEIALKALEFFVEYVHSVLSTKDVFYLAISGGKTPEEFYHLLGTDNRSLSLPWDKIELFWVDERCVQPDSPDSNFKLASSTFLKSVPIPKNNIHRIFGENENYNKAVDDYEETIRNIFGIGRGKLPVFDLMILGMGPDGHIGSLLPNSYALFDTDDLAAVVYQMNEGHNRITLTHPVICASKQILIMVSGQEKAEIVREVFVHEPDEVQYPVHTLWPILEKVIWLIDSDAAKYL